MLLHWMQTRWRTELETGFSLGEPLETEGLPLGLTVSAAIAP